MSDNVKTPAFINQYFSLIKEDASLTKASAKTLVDSLFEIYLTSAEALADKDSVVLLNDSITKACDLLNCLLKEPEKFHLSIIISEVLTLLQASQGKVKEITNNDNPDEASSSGFKKIRYPIVVRKIGFEPSGALQGKTLLGATQCGDLVSVRPIGDEYSGKTYAGFFIGDLALGIGCKFDENQGILTPYLHRYNPAMYVPELGRVVFGFESYWCPIKTVDELRAITDADISNQWYVKMMREMVDQKVSPEPTPAPAPTPAPMPTPPDYHQRRSDDG